MADGNVQTYQAAEVERLHSRVGDIATRFLQSISVVDVVIRHLHDNNTEGMNAELAETLRLARTHMNTAHDDLDSLSGELFRASHQVQS
jgi:hypothetical protein